MKPAFSVLFFTVTSGIGYGLLMFLTFMQIWSSESVNVAHFLVAAVIGLVLATLGLLSSTLHLANPKNAWRAFSRFRTSWLSREGVFSLLFYPVFLAYCLALYLNDGQASGVNFVLGFLSIVVALLVVICTGMIYASLKPIRQWHNSLVTPLYIAFSLMSGSMALIVVNSVQTGSVPNSVLITFLILTLISFALKMAYFKIIGKPEGSTINTATGFSQAQVRLLDAGHNADTFLTKEFVFDAGALKLMKLRYLMIALLFFLPILCVALVHVFDSKLNVFFAMTSVYAGLFVERWLFFAEARHVVRLYHGDQRT